ncbi:MAG: dipeptide/oligopeptide/nickel ABC transporter permease/ATP-binding protein [Solirubrobacteraceae bacterium MAG38_C4-C5]|nr:dipeptide/oligopeptide/nickel ABC transporter permease/ATP-binding protein [Candidatus Siliceabacter maunaloa]
MSAGGIAVQLGLGRLRGQVSPAGRRLAAVGAGLLGVLFLLALLAPLIAPGDPSAPAGIAYQAPSAEYLLGTDDVGHDLFAMLVHGARVSLTIGVLSALVATVIGLGVALAAGWFRGRVESVLMRIVDLALSLPFLVLVIVLAAFFGRGLVTTVLVIAAVLWARPARVLRSQVIKVREFQHVVAARGIGASPLRLIFRHILPRVAPLGVAQFVRSATIAVLIESSLAFLGLGDPSRVSWGNILFFANQRSAFITDAWLWWVLPPGLALTAAILGFAFVGYAVEEWSDPRLGATPRRRARTGRPARPEAADDIEQAPGTVLDVRDLVVEYGPPATAIRAVDGVSFTVAPGSIVGLVGESGSGKSTTAMALLRLLPPGARVVQGAMLFDGRDLRALPPSAMTALRGRGVSLIPQSAMNALNPAYTVRRQVAEAAALLPRTAAAADARARELLEFVGIPSARQDAYPHELSGGMRQRVVIAMAIANEPHLIVADEPVTGLDVVTQVRILRLLAEVQERWGAAIVLVSHDLPLVSRVANELVVMHEGRIVEAGPAAAVTERPEHAHTRALLAPLAVQEGLA